MISVGIYAIIFLLSLVAIVINVYASGIEGNIIHLENGREPSAGASLIGYIIFPIFFMGIAYIGNMVSYGIGWYIAFGLFFIVFLHAAVTIPKSVKKYKHLLSNYRKLS
jgi:hypothetical protein